MSFADMPFNHTADEAFKAFIKPATKPLQPAKESLMQPEALQRPNPTAVRTRNQYLQTQIETASPTRLIVLLYEGAIRFCYLGMEAMNAGNLEEQNKCLVRAQKIVGELMGSLNKGSGGEVAENLMRIYMYLLDRLVDANFEDNPKGIHETIGLLGELKTSWEEVDRLTTISSSPSGGLSSPFTGKGA
ncbi:MAG: flagellar export chaperone FliS [Armatimonadetes bacterium]|nr:flagellar export chaperone FliS [Armatimonadota bacterium]